MEQGNGTENHDAYTVVLFRGSTAKPLRVSFSRKIAHKVLIGLSIFALLDVLVISHYVIRTHEVWELAGLQAEVMSSREQTAAFSTAVNDLKKRLTSMKEVNQRLRVMLGIDVSKTGDIVNGRGGEDISLPVGTGRPAIEKTQKSDAGKLILGSTESAYPAESLPTGSNGPIGHEMIASIKNSLEWLLKEATVQERTLQELSIAAEAKSFRWAATPSIWPVKGWVTSGYGPRVSPFTEKPAWHDGLDIGAAPNAPVQASAQGRVTRVGFDSELGNFVRLDHGFGIDTLYGHLAKSFVKAGQRVKRGEVVGLVGSSGRSTGPHLHYSVRVDGQALDPVNYILE